MWVHTAQPGLDIEPGWSQSTQNCTETNKMDAGQRQTLETILEEDSGPWFC